ncbi:MAG: hypothetical protein ABIB43_01550 [archaeon]
MLKVYRRKLLIGLMSLLLLFALMFALALRDLNLGISLINLGFKQVINNSIVIVLSVLSMLKMVHEIWIIEHHQ